MHLNLATRYQPGGQLPRQPDRRARPRSTPASPPWSTGATTSPRIEHAERAVDGLIDSGIRAVFAHGTAKPPTAEGDTPFTHVPHPRERIEALRKGRLASDDGRVTLAMAILGPDWGSLGGGRARHPHGARVRPGVVVAHAPAGGLRGARRLRAHGQGGPARARPQPRARHELRRGRSQASWSTPARRLTSTVLVELHHHIGDTMVAAFRAAGGLPSLGIDVEPLHAPGRCSARCRRRCCSRAARRCATTRCAATRRSGSIPVRSREALEWATVNGARAFLLDGKIGTLSPGKKADIVMLRANDINMAPVYDPIYSIVEIAGAGNVDTVIIDGDRAQAERQAHVPGRRAAPAHRRADGIRRAHHARGATIAWRAHRIKRIPVAMESAERRLGLLPPPLWGRAIAYGKVAPILHLAGWIGSERQLSRSALDLVLFWVRSRSTPDLPRSPGDAQGHAGGRLDGDRG